MIDLLQPLVLRIAADRHLKRYTILGSWIMYIPIYKEGHYVGIFSSYVLFLHYFDSHWFDYFHAMDDSTIEIPIGWISFRKGHSLLVLRESKDLWKNSKKRPNEFQDSMNSKIGATIALAAR